MHARVNEKLKSLSTTESLQQRQKLSNSFSILFQKILQRTTIFKILMLTSSQILKKSASKHSQVWFETSMTLIESY